MARVLSSFDEMAKQKRPAGRLETVDDEWKDAVRAALKSPSNPGGISRADLARRISVDPASITLLLKPGTSQTRLAGKIAKALDMRSTAGRSVAVVDVDESVEIIMRSVRKMTAEQRRAFALLAKTTVEPR